MHVHVQTPLFKLVFIFHFLQFAAGLNIIVNDKPLAGLPRTFAKYKFSRFTPYLYHTVETSVSNSNQNEKRNIQISNNYGNKVADKLSQARKESREELLLLILCGPANQKGFKKENEKTLQKEEEKNSSQFSNKYNSEIEICSSVLPTPTNKHQKSHLKIAQITNFDTEATHVYLSMTLHTFAISTGTSESSYSNKKLHHDISSVSNDLTKTQDLIVENKKKVPTLYSTHEEKPTKFSECFLYPIAQTQTSKESLKGILVTSLGKDLDYGEREIEQELLRLKQLQAQRRARIIEIGGEGGSGLANSMARLRVNKFFMLLILVLVVLINTNVV